MLRCSHGGAITRLLLALACTVVLPTTTPASVRAKLEDEYGAAVDDNLDLPRNLMDEVNPTRTSLYLPISP